MRDAIEHGVDVDVSRRRTSGAKTKSELSSQKSFRRYPSVSAIGCAPWRGTFIDPSLEYDSGQGLLMVEQEEIPNHHRQAAVTENPSFVAGLWQYFDLLWRHESRSGTQ